MPLAGSRYSQELGGYYHGGLLDRLIHVAPHALWQLVSTALPATLVPYLSPASDSRPRARRLEGAVLAGLDLVP